MILSTTWNRTQKSAKCKKLPRKILILHIQVRDVSRRCSNHTSQDKYHFTGPIVWNKHLSLQKLDETEFSVMNIEEFLKENNIHLHTHTSTVQSRPDSESSCSSPEWEESQSGKPNHCKYLIYIAIGLVHIVKLGSCSSLLKYLISTLKVSIQNQKEQS